MKTTSKKVAIVAIKLALTESRQEEDQLKLKYKEDGIISAAVDLLPIKTIQALQLSQLPFKAPPKTGQQKPTGLSLPGKDIVRSQ